MSIDYTSCFSIMKSITCIRNKYEFFSEQNGGAFRICDREVLKRMDDIGIRDFVWNSEYCVVIPNIVDNTILGLLFRSFPSKEFRYISDNRNIPFGFNVDKKYNEPWIIVESALDCLFLQKTYPNVVSTLGVNISSFFTDLLEGTAPYIIVAFDNDQAGNKCYDSLTRKRKGYNYVRMLPPRGIKDYGDIIENIYKCRYSEYSFQKSYVESTIRSLVG